MNKLKIKSIVVGVIILVTMLMFSENASANNVIVNNSNKKITLFVGKTKTIMIKKASKKVRWKIIKGKKKVKIVKKSGKFNNLIKLKGKKTGKAVIKVINNKKAYKVKITVKKQKTLDKDKEVNVNIENTSPEEETTTSEEYSTEEITTSTEEVTIPSEYESTAQYATVTFVTHGLIEVESIKVKIGEPYGELPDLNMKVEKYLFFGWLTEYYDGVEITAEDVCTGDITLYAELRYIGGAIDDEIIVDE